MNQAERTERNIRAVMMHLRGVSNTRIAETCNISDRQVRRVLERWRESPLRCDTEGAAEAVNGALKIMKDDMEALGITAATASPMDRIMILAKRADQFYKNFQVLADAGICFDGVFDQIYGGPIKDLELIHDVNAAIRDELEKLGVDRITIYKGLEAGIDVYADWGVPIPEAKIDWKEMSERLEKAKAGHESQ